MEVFDPHVGRVAVYVIGLVLGGFVWGYGTAVAVYTKKLENIDRRHRWSA